MPALLAGRAEALASACAQRREARRRQGWKPEGGEIRAAELDAQHESPARSNAEGDVHMPEPYAPSYVSKFDLFHVSYAVS